VARIDSLRKELGDVEAAFDGLVAKELPVVNKSLSQKKLTPIEQLTRKAWDAANSESGGSSGAGDVHVPTLTTAKALMP